MAKGRISKDPNNHRWLKDTTTFGQRILRSHGWTPGSYLGAVDAAHAVHHSAANASYIRVLMKDDAGGLGYRAGGGNGENDIAGIDEVKDIFARLNGKVETEEEKRERERKKALVYLGQRVGGITFVRGGLLVQEGLDMIETSVSVVSATETVVATSGDSSAETMANIGKRKAEEEPDEEMEEDAPRKKRRKDDESRAERKKRKEEKKRKRKERQESEAELSTEVSTEANTPDDTDTGKKSKKKSKKDRSASTTQDEADSSSGVDSGKKKRNKDKKKSKSKTKGAENLSEDPSETSIPDDGEEAPTRSKKDKKSKKESKEKKEKKEKKGKSSKSEPADPDATQASTPTYVESSASTTLVNTPSASGTSTPTGLSKGRHIHHARRVAAKRAAMLDAAALKQILAI
ncbi:hypothetical protein SAPIO_CDS3536 [Scedosporium apiospermum]|uniref:PinX1-related protein 1 n=1 Tax=Pseudallescheria apiosperma TaxID=563466 RepID=A0A084GB05_PSEDA|nr:uncharacterized protein SAPIO_CDS3536 [Scedosporium apiospermum]KEZ44517.1 hypothetical protein SAPIO_CDS3536 [Scedosporium apiospermum]